RRLHRGCTPRVGPRRSRRDRPIRDPRRPRLRGARSLRCPAHRLRRGGAEPLPGLLRLLVHLVDEHPPEPDRRDLVPRCGNGEPGLVPARGSSEPDHHRLGRRGARARLRDRHGDRRRRPCALELGAAREDGPLMRTLQVAQGVAWRTLHNVVTNPSLLLPSLIFPLFFFTAFAGGLSRISDVPGFDYPNGYTAFQFVFVLLQSAVFGGVFTGFGIASDFENGFARRLMLAAPNRFAILFGYALAALVRAVVVGVLLFIVAIATGMRVDGSGVDLFGLVVLALIVNFTAAMWAAGVAMRLRTIQAGPVMQMPVFIVLFLAPVYVPLDLLAGWVEAVAHVNPFTALVEGGRDFISGQDFHVWLMFA